MPRDLADLAVSAARAADSLQSAQVRGVQRSALLIKTAVNAEIRRVTGDMRLSGVGRRGARVAAYYELLSNTRNPTAIVKARGPLHLIEHGTSPHRITPRGLRTSRRTGRRLSGKRGLTIGGGVYSAAEHPGTRARRPFAEGVRRAAPDAPAVFQAEVRTAVVRAWGA